VAGPLDGVAFLLVGREHSTEPLEGLTVSDASRPLLYVGQRLASSVCRTNVVVLDPGSATEVPRCGTVQMGPGSLVPCSVPDRAGRETVTTVAGSIYWDEATRMKVQCTRSGSGRLSLQGREMVVLPFASHWSALEQTAVQA
jgi:hypothetical protein